MLIYNEFKLNKKSIPLLVILITIIILEILYIRYEWLKSIDEIHEHDIRIIYLIL
jgi:hypothetical protein